MSHEEGAPDRQQAPGREASAEGYPQAEGGMNYDNLSYGQVQKLRAIYRRVADVGALAAELERLYPQDAESARTAAAMLQSIHDNLLRGFRT